jgi:DNA-binding NarL/FixJ family response regulator
VRVVIAEDQVLLREGLARLFTDGGHDVVGTHGDAEDLLRSVADAAPDLVVLDVRMPPTHTDEGIRAAAELKAANPALGVLVLSQHVETVHSVGLIEHPGFGYLLKDRVLDVDEFLATCERVAAGGSALDPKVVSNLVAGRRPADTSVDQVVRCTASSLANRAQHRCLRGAMTQVGPARSAADSRTLKY